MTTQVQSTRPSIVLIGLGPGDPALLTHAAAAALSHATPIYTPILDHPTLNIVATQYLHQLPQGEIETIAKFLCDQAITYGDICCALPGHPFDHPLAAAIETLHVTAPHFQVRFIAGISMRDTYCAALGLVAYNDRLQFWPLSAIFAHRLERPRSYDNQSNTPAWCEIRGIDRPYTAPLIPYPLIPTHPTLLWNDRLDTFSSTQVPSTFQEESNAHAIQFVLRLRDMLLLRYPPSHPLHLIQIDQAGSKRQEWKIQLDCLTDIRDLNSVSAIFIAPLEISADQRSLDCLHWVATRLLGPGGCPWDREQTHQTLRKGLLEEVYEVLEALDINDIPALAEELGDLFFQIIVHSEMARQAGHFTLDDVLSQITAKLMRRHPHVFGALTIDETDTILRNWEQIKAWELAKKGRRRLSALDGIPGDLPALATAQELVKKAAGVGFNWNNHQEVWAKLHEELAEFAQASGGGDHQRIAEELGDVLFALTNLARWLNLDAESVLREANHKFRRRFTYIEQAAQAQERQVTMLTIDEMLQLWQKAKHDG